MIEQWFPTLIYFDFLDSIDNKTLEKCAYQLRNESNNHVHTEWNCDTWNSLNTNIDFKDSAITNLVNETIKHTEKYAEEYEADLENYKVVCTDFWFNIAQPDNYQEYHQHPNNHFSAVYYIKGNSNSGNIRFKSMDSIATGNTIPIKTPSQRISGSTETCFYEPQPSKLLLFKSNLLHMVEKNLSTEDRISVAMNFKMEKK